MDISVQNLINLVPVLKRNKDKLIDELTPFINLDCLEHLQNELLVLEDDIFLIEDSVTLNIEGCVLIKKYDGIDQATEIIPWLNGNIVGTIYYAEVLGKVIRIVEQDLTFRHVVLKIDETHAHLIESAEGLGFKKEGIFISNHFLKKEITFYSVYTLELHKMNSGNIN